MKEKFKHQGARSSENNSYLRTARCIYSGNTRTYEVNNKEWDWKKQQSINDRFMRDGCTCTRCVEHRQHLEKLRIALERENDMDGLRAMGFI